MFKECTNKDCERKGKLLPIESFRIKGGKPYWWCRECENRVNLARKNSMRVDPNLRNSVGTPKNLLDVGLNKVKMDLAEFQGGGK